MGDKCSAVLFDLVYPGRQRGSHNRYKALPFPIFGFKELFTKSVELQVLDSVTEMTFLGCLEILVTEIRIHAHKDYRRHKEICWIIHQTKGVACVRSHFRPHSIPVSQGMYGISTDFFILYIFIFFLARACSPIFGMALDYY